MQNSYKVLHVIPNLDQGGAERQLVELVNTNTNHEVCQLLSNGYYEKNLKKKNVKIYNINIKRNITAIRSIFKLYKIIKTSNPQIIHCWMYHSCLLVSLLKYFSFIRGIPLVWGLRCSNMDINYYSFQLNIVIKACKYLSSTPNLIINNSYSGKIIHDKIGFNRESIVISNGIDTQYFSYNEASRIRFRKNYNISNDKIVFLCVARVDPMKDHGTLIKAFNKFKLTNLNTILILAGTGTEKYTNEDKVIALGSYKDINEVYSASDFLISSSSFGEGFSNAISEAMSCKLIPIATDVGDAKKIIANTGKVIPIKNVEELVSAMNELSNLPKKELLIKRNAARERMLNNYSKDKMIIKYHNIYNSLLNNCGK